MSTESGKTLITEARRLRAAATQGEWKLYEDLFSDDVGYLEPHISCSDDNGDLDKTIAIVRIGLQESMNNGEFIAFAANNILAFADKIEEQAGRHLREQ